MRLLTCVLLLEAVICGGIFTARYAFDFADGITYYNLYQAERVERVFAQGKLDCARKRNGCLKQAVEARVQ